MWLENNASEIGGTRARMFHDNNGEEGGNHGMAILTLAALDVIRIRARVVQGANNVVTAANGMRFIIHSIAANGPAGAQGPTGSGSSITVKDNGSTVSGGPHDTLNFVGMDITDNGSSVVTINSNSIVMYSFGGNMNDLNKFAVVNGNANDGDQKVTDPKTQCPVAAGTIIKMVYRVQQRNSSTSLQFLVNTTAAGNAFNIPTTSGVLTSSDFGTITLQDADYLQLKLLAEDDPQQSIWNVFVQLS